MRNIVTLLLVMLPIFATAQSLTIAATDTVTCVGDTLQLRAITTGTTSPHYQWRINNSITGTDTSLLKLTTYSTGDSIQCLLTNAVGDTVFAASNTYTVSITPAPYAGVITGPDTVCLHATITLVASVPGGRWLASNDNAIVTNGAVYGNKVDNFEGLGSRNDTIFYVVGTRCAVDTARIEILIHPPPHVSFQFSERLCVGYTVYLHDYYGNPYFYQTYSAYGNIQCGGGGITGIHAGPDIIIGVDANYCGVDTFRLYVQVEDTPSIGELVISRDRICPGDTLHWYDSFLTVSWDFGCSPNIRSLDYGIVQAVSSGPSRIFVIGHNSCRASITKSQTFTVLDLDPIATSADTLCAGGDILITNGSGPGKWSLSNDSVATLNPSSSKVKTLMAGTDTIHFISNANGCSTSKAITVLPLPSPITGDTLVVQGTPLNLNGQGGKWKLMDSLTYVDSAYFSPTYRNIIAAHGGAAKVYYILPTGCYDSITVHIVDTLQQARIFPNPSNGDVFIQADTSVYEHFTIVDMRGETLYTGALLDQLSHLNISFLPKGLYFFRFFGKKEQLLTMKYVRD